jgi:hypothetical protein
VPAIFQPVLKTPHSDETASSRRLETTHAFCKAVEGVSACLQVVLGQMRRPKEVTELIRFNDKAGEWSNPTRPLR